MPKECPGRAMCSNNAPGCSQEYFSRRSERHPKKPQDEARNFEDDSRRAQGGLWEGHVLKFAGPCAQGVLDTVMALCPDTCVC